MDTVVDAVTAVPVTLFEFVTVEAAAITDTIVAVITVDLIADSTDITVAVMVSMFVITADSMVGLIADTTVGIIIADTMAVTAVTMAEDITTAEVDTATMCVTTEAAAIIMAVDVIITADTIMEAAAVITIVTTMAAVSGTPFAMLLHARLTMLAAVVADTTIALRLCIARLQSTVLSTALQLQSTVPSTALLQSTALLPCSAGGVAGVAAVVVNRYRLHEPKLVASELFGASGNYNVHSVAVIVSVIVTVTSLRARYYQ